MGAITKWSFLLFSSVFFVATLNAQYPATGNKQRLGWQTTGDGLVYRGAIADTSTLDPSGLNNAWMLLDTASGNLYAYRIKAWRLVSGGGGGGGVSMPFDSVTFNINEGDASEQELKYSADKGYLQYGGLDSVQIPLLPGIWYVRNDTSVTIPKGTVVRATGTLGASGRIKVKHMIANGSIPAMYVLGIAMQDIAVGADGYVMTQGKIRQVNTTAYSEGAVLYADVDTLGGLTQTEPGNGYLKLPIAFVVHSASNGTLAVRIDPGSSLHDLHDVDTTGRVNSSVLRYDSALKYWKASTTAGIVAGDTAAMLTNYINVADTSAMLSTYLKKVDTLSLSNRINTKLNISDTTAMLSLYLKKVDTTSLSNRINLKLNIADTSVFARNFQLSGTSGQVTYFNGSNTVTGDANLTWSAANRTLGINTTTTSGANIIIKNTQEPVRDAAWLPQQTFGADTTNWTRGTGWTFNGTQAVATAATGALTYTTLPDTIISGRAYEVTYTLAGYSAGSITVAVGNATLLLPAHNISDNIVLLQPTSATGGFRFTTSNFTGRLDNIAVVEVRNQAPIAIAGQDDNSNTLYADYVFPNSSTIAMGGGGRVTTGSDNMFLGENAGFSTTTGIRNNFIGYEAGYYTTSGAYNSFIGSRAGYSTTTGTQNNFIGFNTGLSNTSGNLNSFIGSQTGYSNTVGGQNTFLGPEAGYSNIDGNQNNFIGFQSGRSNIGGDQNIFIGFQSGFSNIGGDVNLFLGSQAGYSNTTGYFNNFIGYISGYLNRSGISNNAIGFRSGYSIRSGSGNTFIGDLSGFNNTLADTLSGSNNTAIGYNSATNIASSASGNLVLGNSVNLPTGNGSNQVVIKNLIFGTGASGTGTTIQTTAKAGINVNNPQSTLDVEGNMAIGATYSGTTAAPTNGLIVEGNTGIGTSSPQRRLHITGTVRVDTLTRDVPTRVLGADADGDLGAVTLGTGLSISSGTLNGPSVSGTTNYLPKFTGTNSIGNSLFFDNGTQTMIGGTTPAYNLSRFSIYYNPVATGPPILADTRAYNSAILPGGSWNIGGRYDSLGTYASFVAFAGKKENSNNLDTKGEAQIFVNNGGDIFPDEAIRIKSDGKVGIATTSPSRTLHINSTDALKLPAGTTAERPSVGITGDLRMNTSPAADSLEYYNGTSWVTVQDKLQNPVTGTGTTNRLAKFTGTSSLGDSPIVLTGDTLITFGTSPLAPITINTEAFPNTPGQMPYTKFKLNTGYGINGISMGDPSGPSFGTQTALQFTTYDGTASGGFDYWSTRLTGDGFGNFHISNSPANSDGDTVMTNRLSITAAGKVGINKTAPDSTLDVVGSSYITGNMLLNGRLGVGAQNQRHKAYFYGTGNGYAIPDTGVYILNNSSSSSPNVGLAVRQLSPGWESSNTGISGYASGWYNNIVGVLGMSRIGDLNSIATTAIGIRGEVDTATYTSNPGSFQSTTIAGYFKNNMRRGGNHYGVFIQTDSAGDYGIYQTGFGVNYLAGKLGIGTTSPAHTLDISGETGITTNRINFASTNGGVGNPGSYIAGEKVGNWGGRIDFYARDAAGSLTKNVMSVEGSGGTGGGFVGIRTTTPLRPFHINAADAIRIPAGTDAQRVTSGVSDANGDLRFNTTSNNLEWYQQSTGNWRQPVISASATGLNTAGRFAKFTANGLDSSNVLVQNGDKVGIGTSTAARTLHVEGEARITDLTTDTPTRIVGADADGDLGAITLGTGLSISSGTLNASGITSVYIPINLFSPGDTVTNTTNAKNFFLVHSGLNGYCIDSYTVKAIAGTGTADIQVDKNDTGGNLQSISGTTVYTKDTNIALVTGDYIRGQVFNLSGTLVGLGLTLEIKATCN